MENVNCTTINSFSNTQQTCWQIFWRRKDSAWRYFIESTENTVALLFHYFFLLFPILSVNNYQTVFQQSEAPLVLHTMKSNFRVYVRSITVVHVTLCKHSVSYKRRETSSVRRSFINWIRVYIILYNTSISAVRQPLHIICHCCATFVLATHHTLFTPITEEKQFSNTGTSSKVLKYLFSYKF